MSKSINARLEKLEAESPSFNLRLATNEELQLLKELSEMKEPIDWSTVSIETIQALEKVTIKRVYEQ